MTEWIVDTVLGIDIPNGIKSETTVCLRFKDTWMTASQRDQWFESGHNGQQIAERDGVVQKEMLIRWDHVNVHFHELVDLDVVHIVSVDPDAHIPRHKILNKVLKFVADMPPDQKVLLPACMQQQPIDSGSDSDIEMDGLKWSS